MNEWHARKNKENHVEFDHFSNKNQLSPLFFIFFSDGAKNLCRTSSTKQYTADALSTYLNKNLNVKKKSDRILLMQIAVVLTSEQNVS